MRLLAAFFILSMCLALPKYSRAEAALEPMTILLSQQDSDEEQKLRLAPGERAGITAYLMSHGEMVNAFRLSLVLLPQDRVVETATSDVNGVVTFAPVPPGRYHILMWKARRNSLHRVRIGDMRIKRIVSDDPAALAEVEAANAAAASAARDEEGDDPEEGGDPTESPSHIELTQ